MDEYRFLCGLVAEGEEDAALAALKDRGLLCQMMNAQQHDVMIKCHGDFADNAERMRYAEFIAAQLNQSSKLVSVEAERDRLREALEWYSDPANWKPGQYITSMGVHRAGLAEKDRGMAARQALQGTDND